MRRALHFLVVLAVLWCGLHAPGPADAHEAAGHGQVELNARLAADDTEGVPKGAASGAHAGHHHCPVAPDDCGAPLLHDPAATDALLFARPIAALRSLSRAPPIEPPAA